jgi:hypothetical protein
VGRQSWCGLGGALTARTAKGGTVVGSAVQDGGLGQLFRARCSPPTKGVLSCTKRHGGWVWVLDGCAWWWVWCGVAVAVASGEWRVGDGWMANCQVSQDASGGWGEACDSGYHLYLSGGCHGTRSNGV